MRSALQGHVTTSTVQRLDGYRMTEQQEKLASFLPRFWVLQTGRRWPCMLPASGGGRFFVTPRVLDLLPMENVAAAFGMHGAAFGRYGITGAEHRMLLRDQQWKCACCGTRPPQVIDHHHFEGYAGPCGAGRVRGIVCRSCNARIGVYEAQGRRGNLRGSTADIRRYLARSNPLGYVKNPAISTE